MAGLTSCYLASMLISSWTLGDSISVVLQGLCLVDWGRGIDLHLFPENMEFNGDSRTSCFRCVEMQENKPWKYQVSFSFKHWPLLFYASCTWKGLLELPVSLIAIRLIYMAFVLSPIWCCMVLTWRLRGQGQPAVTMNTHQNPLWKGISSCFCFKTSFLMRQGSIYACGYRYMDKCNFLNTNNERLLWLFNQVLACGFVEKAVHRSA